LREGGEKVDQNTEENILLLKKKNFREKTNHCYGGHEKPPSLGSTVFKTEKKHFIAKRKK